MPGKIIDQKIEISASHNMGFLVKIGCCTLVYANYQDLLAGLRKYLSDPKKWEKKYSEITNQPMVTPGETITWIAAPVITNGATAAITYTTT